MLALLCLLSSPGLAADPGTADFTNKGFTISDAKKENTLSLGLSFQPRYTVTLSGDPDATDADAVTNMGLRMRRMLFLASGTVYGHLDYRFRIDAAKAFSFTDGADGTQQTTKPILDDAQVVYRFTDAAQISVGQWKVPFSSSQMASDTTLLMPDRPIVLDGFSAGDVKVSGFSYSRDIGAAFLGNALDKKLEYAVGAFSGDGSNVWPPADDGMLAVGRVAFAPLGEFKYDEVDIQREEARFAVGLNAGYNTKPAVDDAEAKDGADRELRAGADLRFAVKGLGLNGEVFYGSASPHDGSDPTNRLGFYGQVGYCLPQGIAPGVRFSRVDPSLDAEDDGVSQLEGVVNYYLPKADGKGNVGHKAQLQLAWTTSLADAVDHPLSHTLQLAGAVGF